MKKMILLAGAMLVATPALAQQTPPVTGQIPPATDQTAPVDTVPPAQSTPDPMTQTTSPADTVPATDASAASTGTAGTTQVAQAVESQWATYDKDSNGKLSKTEFAAWMTALRASDPNAKMSSGEMRKWSDAAFVQSDTDKSRSVSKDELTAFLAKAQG